MVLHNQEWECLQDQGWVVPHNLEWECLLVKEWDNQDIPGEVYSSRGGLLIQTPCLIQFK